MTSAQQRSTLNASNCELAFDNLTRQLYATDASHYQVEPGAVAFPKGTRQALSVVQAAVQAGIAVSPRGAGTGLVGGALGAGLVIDFARHNRAITDLDLERETVRVQPGVILDQLNAFLRPRGYCFGPDVATSARATLGGMIANNSSGAHTPYYGTTTDHINELEVVMASGDVVMVGPGHDTLRKQRELVRDLVYFHALEIEDRLPGVLVKRRPGYALDRLRRDPNNLVHLVCGSEGTLAAITMAELKIVRLPRTRGLGLVFFDSVAEAAAATVELLDLKAAAIELLDRVLLDQTRGQREFQAARDLMGLESQPAEAVLVVEFFDHVPEKLLALARRKLGGRQMILRQAFEAELVWSLRKAGLSLLTGRKGAAKPVTCIEDTAVAPARLGEYVAGLEDILGRHGLEASFYGHAASGLLHVRPVLDLHLVDEVVRFRAITEEVAELVVRFKGSFAAEHGVGMARTEFMSGQLGEALVGAMREIKHAFDPHNVFNPGKIVPVPELEYRLDTNLRVVPGQELRLPFKPVLAFAAKDGSFLGNLEQCNGCGGCRKETPSMCPTFPVTGEEWLSTRGRANAIRSVLELHGVADALRSGELEAALSSCLSCKACVSECPSNVDLALLKADLAHARIKRDGLRMRERLISRVDVLGALGCKFPRIANYLVGSFFVRTGIGKLTGLAWQRPLPKYARVRFDDWFRTHPPVGKPARGRVVLWDDTFVRYHEPHIGVAAVRVLEAAGFRVDLAQGRVCCGRPAFSQGDLDRAGTLGQANLDLLLQASDQAPIIFLEPSCYSMFVSDYRELKLQGVERVAPLCFLFEEFIEELLTRDPAALTLRPKGGRVLVHGHCHVKSLLGQGFLLSMAQRLPGRTVMLLDTGCCGMAGGFGMQQKNYELSLKVADPLAQQVRQQPYGTVVVASGTSCRQQIQHLAPTRPRHMAEVLADAL